MTDLKKAAHHYVGTFDCVDDAVVAANTARAIEAALKEKNHE